MGTIEITASESEKKKMFASEVVMLIRDAARFNHDRQAKNPKEQVFFNFTKFIFEGPNDLMSDEIMFLSGLNQRLALTMKTFGVEKSTPEIVDLIQNIDNQHKPIYESSQNSETN